MEGSLVMGVGEVVRPEKVVQGGEGHFEDHGLLVEGVGRGDQVAG